MAVRAPADPFGARPRAQGSGWVRIVLGVVLLVGGLVVTALGIVDAVRASARLHDDAVARAAGPGAVTFVNGASERRSYTVYLDFDGVTRNSTVQELVVRDTACTATMPDGVETRFRGAVQGTSMTLGSASSVGHFSSQPGRVTVRCGFTNGTRSSRVRRPDAVPWLVTLGRPSGPMGAVGLITGGVGAGLLCGWLLVSGLRRRRPRGTLRR